MGVLSKPRPNHRENGVNNVKMAGLEGVGCKFDVEVAS